MAIADLGQEHGVAVLLADMDVFAGLMEGHCLCFFFFFLLLLLTIFQTGTW